MTKITISTTIDNDLNIKAKERGILLTDALDFGIRFKMAEKDEINDVEDYDEYPDCWKLRKMFQKLDILQKDIIKKNEEIAKIASKEADDVLKSIKKEDGTKKE